MVRTLKEQGRRSAAMKFLSILGFVVSVLGLSAVAVLFLLQSPHFDLGLTKIQVAVKNWMLYYLLEYYYPIGAPLFLILTPLTLRYLLKTRGGASMRLDVGLLVTFAVAFIFMAPILPVQTIYEWHCEAFNINLQSFGYYLFRVGSHYWTLYCI